MSASHAAIRYVGSGWRLRDLGSTNGTWLNGAVASSEEDEALERGDLLCFGHPDGEAWELIDDGPPEAFVWSAGRRQQVVAAGDRLEVPGGPALVSGVEGWVVEHDGDAGPLGNGASVPGAEGWELWIPAPLSTRRVPFDLDGLEVLLELRGEEASLTIVQRGVRLSFGCRRPWTLLYWLADERQGDPSQGGWVALETLEARVGVGRKLLDMWAKRARDALAAHGVQGAEGIVEASGDGSRRIGVAPERLSLDGERS